VKKIINQYFKFFSVFILGLISFSANQVPAQTNQFGPTPTFAPPVSYPLPGFDLYGHIAAGDLNHDGKPDIVMIPSYESPSIYVFLNNGSGGFGQPAEFVTNVNAQYTDSVLLYDYNNDGNLDLIRGDRATVYVSLGDGNGNFGETFAWEQFAGSAGPSFEIGIGDFNNDGKLDIVTRNYSCYNLYLLNALDPQPINVSFFFTGTGDEIFGLSISDFNGDGNSDFLSQGVMYFGDGTGNFNFGHYFYPTIPASAQPLPPQDINEVNLYTLGDFNGDGKTDIATPYVTVHIGDGTGSFAPGVYYPVGTAMGSYQAYDVRNADFNNDGKLDLLAVGWGSLSILSGKGDGTFGGLTTFPGTESVQGLKTAIADFNGDGKLDIAEMGYDGGYPGPPELVILFNTTYQTPVGQNSTVTLPQADFSFDEVTSGGTTSVTSIDPATAGDVPGGFALADLAFEVSTTATFTGSVTTCFNVPTVNDQTEFNNLRVLHNENGALIDRTSSHDYPNRKICATTTSFSPFYLATVGKKVQSMFDRSKAFKSGSTVPVKVKILNQNSQNISSATLVLTARGLRKIGSNTTNEVTDAGNSNPDFTFRYDSGLQGYIYNLKTTGLTSGKYVLSFYAGSDHTFFYTVQFEVK